MLELDRVAKRFGAVVACAEVSFAVRYGEVFGLVGTTGAGKTTVSRIAAGLLTPDAGAVRRAGERLGYLPEERGLYPGMRVLDHLIYLAELHGADAGDALRAAEVWATRFGLRHRCGDRVRQLSAAEAHRLPLAAAFVHFPDVVVLDEPVTGLDPATTGVLTDVVRERAATGAAVLVATEDPAVVELLCDRVGLLHNGRVMAEGAVEDMRASARVELVVDAPAAPADWAAGLPGVVILGVHNGRTRLALATGADDQAVLAAALATGPVHGFTRVRPSLEDAFRHVLGTRS